MVYGSGPLGGLRKAIPLPTALHASDVTTILWTLPPHVNVNETHALFGTTSSFFSRGGTGHRSLDLSPLPGAAAWLGCCTVIDICFLVLVDLIFFS